VRSFEVFLAQVGADEDKSVVFSSVPAEADRQSQQLRGVLLRLGATPSTPVTILSDGADGPRSLGEAACVGPTSHALGRVGGDVAIPTPHRPGRAGFPHPVLHARASLAAT
jgi:hypothetical protein